MELNVPALLGQGGSGEYGLSSYMVAGKSGVSGDLEGGNVYGGVPAVPIRQWHRQVATLARLVKRKRGESG